MKRTAILYVLLLIALAIAVNAQTARNGRNVMWEQVNIPSRDLFNGPGGESMKPDLSRVKFLEEEKSGHNKKYRIKDGSGKVWVAKLGREAKPEIAAVRLLYGIGYKTEVNYFVPSITIPGKGTFEDVRLEARPDNIKRLDEWKWKDNPFVGTKELQGLKIMMVFMSNWDVLDLQNKVLAVDGENHYIVSDLGATFGKLGGNNFPVIYRLGRKTGDPEHFENTKLVRFVEDGEVELAYKGKNRGVFKGFTVDDARWLSGLLAQLSDKQIGDAFRAAAYNEEEVASFTAAVRSKIVELQNAAMGKETEGN